MRDFGFLDFALSRRAPLACQSFSLNDVGSWYGLAQDDDDGKVSPDQEDSAVFIRLFEGWRVRLTDS